MKIGDRVVLRHPSAPEWVRYLGEIEPDGVRRRALVRLPHGGELVCALADLFPLTEPTPLARNTDPDTSHDAPNRSRLEADRRLVLETHAEHPDGLTDFELASIHGRQQTSLGKRRGELRDAGLIARTDMKRPAPSGAMSIVWKITQQGAEQARQEETTS